MAHVGPTSICTQGIGAMWYVKYFHGLKSRLHGLISYYVDLKSTLVRDALITSQAIFGTQLRWYTKNAG